MLVLTRKIGDTIMIGDGDESIEVVILSIDRNKVRVGVKAPPEVSIHRDEVYARIHGDPCRVS